MKILLNGKRKITGSEWIDALGTRAYNRMERVAYRINEMYPAIEVIDIDKRDAIGNRGGRRGFELIFTLDSERKEFRGLEIGAKFARSIDQVKENDMVAGFQREFDDFLEFKGLSAE